MQRTHFTNNLDNMIGKEVIISGWVHDVRFLGGINFMLLRDIGGMVQITILKKNTDKKIIDIVAKTHQEDTVSVKGTVVESKISKSGYEIIPKEIEIISRASVPLPLDPREVTPTNFDTRLDNRILDLRKPENLAIFKIESNLMFFIHEWLRNKNFINVNTPCLMGGASESGSEVFKVEYFGDKTFLRQDPQLHRQLMMQTGFDKIYDLGPNWRAEPSFTTRHLTEFRSVAVEMSFIKDEYDVMKVQEELSIYIIKKTVEYCEKELELLKKEVNIPKKRFPILKFPDIYKILEEFGQKITFGEDYDRESEKLLSNYIKEKYGHEFFFVNKFPYKIKPFYVMKDDDVQWARSVDMVFKGLEQSSGGQREHRYDKIIEQIKEKKMNPKQLEWFTNPFKFGSVPHGGFAIGIERFTQKLLDLDNVRETTLFPRDPKRIIP